MKKKKVNFTSTKNDLARTDDDLNTDIKITETPKNLYLFIICFRTANKLALALPKTSDPH